MWFEAISQVRRSWQFLIDLFVPPWAGAFCLPAAPRAISNFSKFSPASRRQNPGHSPQSPQAVYQLGFRTPDPRDVTHLHGFSWIDGAMKTAPCGLGGTAVRTPSPTRIPTAISWEPHVRAASDDPRLVHCCSEISQAQGWTKLEFRRGN